MILALIGALLAALVLFLWLADWNRLRAPIARFASARTHRQIVLDGPLKVHLLSLAPSVSIGGLKIGNPGWAGPGDVADIDRVLISVRLWPLLIGRVRAPLVEFDRPEVNLLRDQSGRQNWDLSGPGPKTKPFSLPPIQRFVVLDGHLKFTDQSRKLHIDARVSSNELANGPQSHAFSLKGQGSLNGEPFELQAAGGPLLNLQVGKPYPFTGELKAGATRVTAVGRLAKPFDFGAFSTDLTMSGRDLADLYYLTGLALPNTPAYAIKGVLTRSGRNFSFDQGAGRIGQSDLEGRLTVKLSEADRPSVDAVLRSRSLDIRDLATLFGAPPVGASLKTATSRQRAQAAELAASQRLLPDATLATPRLRGMDAKLDYRAGTVTSAFMPIRGAALSLRLDHGLLSVDPVSFALPVGRLWAEITLDARSDRPVTDADVRLSNADLQEFLPRANDASPPLEGVMAARVKVRGRGDSVHKAAADANGAVTLVIPHGRIRTAFAELLGVNAGKGLGLLLAKNHGQTDIRCAVANFTVTDGVMRAQDVIFDTDVVKVKGSGDVDLGPESLDLTLKGDTKHFRITHLVLPITLKGHLRSPKLGVQAGPTLAQGAAAVALGAVLTPLAAVLPFVDPGLAKNADCAALMAEARSTAAPVTAAAAKPRPKAHN